MNPVIIPNHTRALGAPRDWDAERDGECGVLVIRDAPCGAMLSHWLPTDDEMTALLEGAAIELSVFGRNHPPVMLSVVRT